MADYGGYTDEKTDPLDLGKISREGVARTSNVKAAAASAAKAPAAKAKFPPPPAPPPVKKQVPLEMPIEQKSAHVDRILAYREKFAWLKKRNGAVTAKSADADLLDELHYIEVQLGSKSTSDSNVGTSLFGAAMSGLEMSTHVFNPLQLDLTGLGKVATDNADQFKDIIDELMIKYATGVHVSPEARLVLGVGALVMTVHAANTGDPRVKEALGRMNMSVGTDKHSDL
jgi:hypothetical protein